jgi:hypothetical protein
MAGEIYAFLGGFRPNVYLNNSSAVTTDLTISEWMLRSIGWTVTKVRWNFFGELHLADVDNIVGTVDQQVNLHTIRAVITADNKR